MINSSEILDRCTAVKLMLNNISAIKSLSLTASIEFCVISLNPKSRAIFFRSNLNRFPASAPEPSGEVLRLVSEFLKRLKSL